ncbi:hypothetical protein [Virgisporangium ochraceum]|uniref:Uncharacterized protein n=1 Tax=Virgisporangium ochraceum TaxID=65505 RepID=A0A8J3ZR32_9ACTN|nr:hypothetical protein [Virgisporangium ochraceum]GIJ68642.1 hypothetical protein Voc01_035590 [Virgisporangium ochraceum]
MPERRAPDRRTRDREQRVPEQRIEARAAAPARGSAVVAAAAAVGVPPINVPVPAHVADEPGRRDQAGPVPLPRRRAAEPRRWPANPADDNRVVEECSDSTLMRIQRALRALR